MHGPLARSLQVLALLVLGACASPAADPRAPAPRTPPPPVETAPGVLPGDAAGEAVVARLVVLDGNERAPKHLADDRSLLAGARAVLGAVARCRTETRSRAHWVEIEWQVDAAGRVLKTVAHPVFIPPEGQPRAIEDATLRCIEQRAAAPPFTGATGAATARAFALIGFDLPEPASGEAVEEVPFVPELDGHCRLQEDCPADKHCEAPPRVPCPRARAANPRAPGSGPEVGP